ncbi:RNA polymerase sigma-70 factor, sigma-E family [Jatrophihabitans endophyticus]|uniref:RNA polymerase sigma-70 factor, sigma-E family n=1 Tax=Jatrophihabitans endophyticus TaxID=1206085 RepID=A0A1M5Q521_9ACTN|nr:SigE family RNA polymerase sigma factor [Jatrophihabitans endophyticus]SHH08950.1 RNA polymerase sigma-70 factor, sigma-E family [Jatrophihabitans endophyticus]
MTIGTTFEAYVGERRGALRRFAVVLCGDPVLAEDLVQDVLARVFERWAQVSAADSVHAYVRRMLVNEFLTWRRRTGRTRSYADLDAYLTPVADPADGRADALALVAELARLPRQQRAALVLRYYEDMPYAEIAEVLGSGENAARSNVSRALANLRIELAGDPPAGSPSRMEARP